MAKSHEQTQTQTSSTAPPAYAQPAIQAGIGAIQADYNAGASAPNPLVAQAQDYFGQVLGGDFLNPATNPNLQATFDTAAQATQNRLSSEFAGAGRNVGASFPARSQELQTLASSIYGGAYNNERNIQSQSLGLLPMVAGLDDLNLDQYIQRLGQVTPLAGQNSTSTGVTQTPSNPFAGALGGAAAGAAFGPWGAGIGAGIGLLGSL